jgi:hypothetical protein
MTDVEKTALLEKKRRFDALPKAEKERMKKLCTDLSSHPHRDRLRKVLMRYNDWLRTLSPGVKAQILSLPTNERIARIEEELGKQEPQRFQWIAGARLRREDLKVIGQWLDQFVDDHEKEILEALPDRFDEFKRDYDPVKHRRQLTFILFRLDDPDLPRPTREDEQRLQQAFSSDAREFLKQAASDDELSRVLANWIRAASGSRMRFAFSHEELDSFVAQMDAGERERLENLPRDRMYRELAGKYFMHWYWKTFGGSMHWPGMRRGGPGRSGMGPGRGGPSRRWPPREKPRPDKEKDDQ